MVIIFFDCHTLSHFDRHPCGILKIFLIATRMGDWRNLIVLFVVVEEFSIANVVGTTIFLVIVFCGNWNFLVATEGGRVICF